MVFAQKEIDSKSRNAFWRGGFLLALTVAIFCFGSPARADLAYLSGALINFPDSSIFVFDTEDQSLVASRAPQQDVSGYFSLSFSADAKTLFGGPSNVDVLEVFQPNVPGSLEIFPLSEQPQWIAPLDDGSQVYVSTFTTLEAIDLETGEARIVRENQGFAGIAGSPESRELYLAFNGTLFPSRESSLVIFDTETDAVTGRVALGPDFALFAGVTVSPDGSRVYVANSEPGRPLVVIDPVQQEVVARIFFDGVDAAYASSFGPDPSRLYVSTRDGAAVIDTISNTVIASTKLDFFHTAIDVDEAGGQVYVMSGAGRVAVLDPETLELLDTLRVPGGEVFNSTRFIVPAP